MTPVAVAYATIASRMATCALYTAGAVFHAQDHTTPTPSASRAAHEEVLSNGPAAGVRQRAADPST